MQVSVVILQQARTNAAPLLSDAQNLKRTVCIAEPIPIHKWRTTQSEQHYENRTQDRCEQKESAINGQQQTKVEGGGGRSYQTKSWRDCSTNPLNFLHGKYCIK